MKLITTPLAIASALSLLAGCESPTESSISENEIECSEPENPYGDGGGHDAGFNWAQENAGACTGNSESFNEGCQEYFNQLSRYQACEVSKRSE